jgi:hypothetical protein
MTVPQASERLSFPLGPIRLHVGSELTVLAGPTESAAQDHRLRFLPPGEDAPADEPGLGRGRIESAAAQPCCGLAVTRELFTPADGAPFRAVRLRVRNDSSETAWVDELRPVVIEGDGLDLGGPAGRWTFLRQPRFKNGMPAAVVLGEDSPAMIDVVAGLSETGQAVETPAGGYPCEFTSGEVMSLLGPAGALTIGQLPADRQAARSTLTMNAARDRPTVWCSWYYFDEEFTQARAETQLDWLGENPLPIDVFQIDDCWSARWGDWQPNVDWPDLPGLAERIGSMGMAAGIWTCPTLAEPRSRLRFAHDDWLLRDRAGAAIRFFMSGTDCFVLDPTNPAVLEWTEALYRQLTEQWGFAYHKIDFTRSVVQGQPRYHDPTQTPAEAYRMLIEAIRRGIGQKGYLCLCGGQYGPAVGVADGQRSGSDVRSEWPAPPPGEEAHGYGPFTIKQNTLLFWMNRLWDNDPDAMMVRRRSEPAGLRHLSLGLLNDDEAITIALNQYLGGGLACFSENLTEVDTDRLMLLRHCAPSIGRSARPADLAEGRRYPAVCVTDVQPRAAGLQPWVTVAVINWFDEPRSFELCLDESLLGDRAELLGSDGLMLSAFRAGWDRAASPGETISVGPLAPHGCEVVKVQPARPGWMLLGTDGHFSMGGVEVTRFDPAADRPSIEVAWPWPVDLTLRVTTAETLDSPEVLTVRPGQTHLDCS